MALENLFEQIRFDYFWMVGAYKVGAQNRVAGTLIADFKTA